ncbi:hypothetical protein ACP70R_013652 [Stipagrostis hirtigluma subsp. patula]
MESENFQNHLEDEDRLSKLPDEILLYILEKANTYTSIRASFLSTRWRHLPTLLPHISLETEDFMRSKKTSIFQLVLDEAMSAMTKAVRVCLAVPRRETTMKTVSLRLCLTAKHLYDIGKLVCEAIDSGKVKSAELFLPTEKFSLDCDVVDMVQHARNLVYFSEACPNLFRCLTTLSLHNARFDELQMHCLLNLCEQLQHLMLNNCDTGDGSVLKIDMPKSKISRLNLRSCRFEKVDFFCLPKLTELHFECWFSLNTPFSFGFVPCLDELHLACAAARYQSGLSLTQLLHGTTNIQALTLDFQGEKIWMLPEGKKLYTSFNKLSKLFIHGVYVNFGLLWTGALLEAAPSLKRFGIKVWDHVCDADSEFRRVFPKRTNSWDKNNIISNSRHLQLTRLEFGGFHGNRETYRVYKCCHGLCS